MVEPFSKEGLIPDVTAHFILSDFATIRAREILSGVEKLYVKQEKLLTSASNYIIN